MTSWKNAEIPVVFYEAQGKPEAIPYNLLGWNAVARNLRDQNGDDVGLDLCSPAERHDCDLAPDGRCRKKDGYAWSPVVLRENYRLDANVTSVTLAVFDLDHVPQSDVDIVLDHLVAEKIAFVCHSTHGHAPPADASVRVVMPLSRPVTPFEWKRLFAQIPQAYKIPQADPHCKNVSRLYFLPRIPKGSKYFFRENNGRPLDVEALLSRPAPALGPTPAPSYDEPAAADLDALRAPLRTYQRTKKNDDPIGVALFRRVLAGKALATPGGSNAADVDGVPPGRDSAINKVASILAFILPADTPSDAVVEIVRPSIAAMTCEPEGLDFWLEKARGSFNRAAVRRAERDEQQAQEAAYIRDALNTSLAARKRPAPAVQAAPTPNSEAIEKGLARDKNGKAFPTRLNIEKVIELSPETGRMIRWNEYAKKIEVVDGPFKDVPLDVLPSEIASWLERQWNLPAKTTDVKEAVILSAYRNSYNPLRDYLSSIEWDGVPRIDELLTSYVDARVTGAGGEDLRPLLRAFGRKWLIGAVARALKPGCKLDTVLVLEGEEGIKKTTFFETLGGPFYESTAIHVGDKDAKQAASSAWIIELAEMAALRKSENTVQKAFFSDRKDFYRRPYGAAYESTPRGCVFVGTVNPTDFYLPQNDKNRRYWCVYVNSEIDVKRLAADRDQLWAEAVAAYVKGLDESGEPADCLWWLDPEENSAALAQAAEKVESSVFARKIEQWWCRIPLEKRADYRFTLEDVMAEALLIMETDPKRLHSIRTEVGIAVRQHGFFSSRHRVNGRLSTVYQASPKMLTAEELPAAEPSAPVHANATVVDIATARTAAAKVGR